MRRQWCYELPNPIHYKGDQLNFFEKIIMRKELGHSKTFLQKMQFVQLAKC